MAEAEEARATAEIIAADVAHNQAIVSAETAKANELAHDASIVAARADAIRADAERDLALAIPAVERAMNALDSLDRKELAECKTMSTPPKGVDDVFAAVAVLLAGVHKGIVADKRGKVRQNSTR